MNQLLEILGRAITIDTAELMWHWLDEVGHPEAGDDAVQGDRLDEAVRLIGQGRLNEAEERLRLHLFDNPSCIYGRLAAATIYLYRNQLRETIEELTSVYVRRPSNTMALYALGYCYERLGKEAEAVEFYQDCLKFKSYLQLPAQRLAAIYFKNGRPRDTVRQYEILRDEYPDDLSTLVTLGHLYIALGEHSKAIERFNTAILIHPDNFQLDNDDIEVLIRNGQLHEALEAIDELLGESCEKPELLVKRGDALGMLGATDESNSQYEQAIRLAPDFLEAAIKLGTQYLQLGREKEAAHQFNKALEINDRIIDAYFGLAVAQNLSGNSSEALNTLSLAATIEPNSLLLFSQTAILIFKACLGPNLQGASEPHSLAEAVITTHREELSVHPHNPDLHYRTGILLAGAGMHSAAIDCFRSALEINPTFTRARSKLALSLFEAGEKQSALALLAPSEPLDSETLELHYKTALLYCNRLKFASSLLNLDRHIESNLTAAEPIANISIVLQNLGLLDRVSAMWENLSATAEDAATPHSPQEG